MDDSALYTGIDGEVAGTFGNEIKEDKLKRTADEQDRLIRELTPQLEEILALIDSEKDIAIQFIADTVDKSLESDDIIRAELKAAARYRTYLDGLKTKFILALNKTKER